MDLSKKLKLNNVDIVLVVGSTKFRFKRVQKTIVSLFRDSVVSFSLRWFCSTRSSSVVSYNHDKFISLTLRQSEVTNGESVVTQKYCFFRKFFMKTSFVFRYDYYCPGNGIKDYEH